MDPAWIAAATVAAFAGWAARWFWRIATRTSHFLDDYFGRPEADGLPARPGVMARLTALEKLAMRTVAETQPNGGNSLRDLVDRTATDSPSISCAGTLFERVN